MKRAVVCAVLLAVLGGAAIVRANSARAVIPYPSEAVSGALDRLSAPSVPRPLPGDSVIAVLRNGHAGPCDEVRAAYQAAGAPLPDGAEPTIDAVGNIQVAAPFGQAGIVLGDRTGGGCEYAIERSPTLVISGLGVRETQSFTTVVCSSILGIDIAAGDFDAPDGPFYLMAVMGQTADTASTWKLGIAGGHFVDALKGHATPGASTEKIEWTAPVTKTSTGYVFDGDGPQGPAHVEMNCTPYKGSS